MAQPAVSKSATAAAPPEPDSVVVLRGGTWADYQRVLELRGDRTVPRLAYLDGVLELMSPSHGHEAVKSMIGCLVEAWCMERDVGVTPYGSWTHESKEKNSGIEPDECYVLGEDPEPPRCDLAIEVVWTRSAIRKLEIYRRLGVREVWVWKDGRISVFELQAGQYAEVESSRVLPGIDLPLLLSFIDIRPMTRAVREYRAALAAGARDAVE